MNSMTRRMSGKSDERNAMSTPKLLTLALAALAALALSTTGAMAGSWPPISSKKVSARADECCSVTAAKKADAKEAKAAKSAPALVSADGFEYVGGESGWLLAQHKLELRKGRFAHAADCPISVAKARVGNVAPIGPS
jgi:hypothetical protein